MNALTWREPELLGWLLTVPCLIAGFIAVARGRHRRTTTFGHGPTVEALVTGQSRARRATRNTLLVIGVACGLLALAGPRFGGRTEMLKRRGIDIVVALDFSKSMLAKDVTPSRIERAKAEVGRLIEQQEGHRVGLVAFAGDTMEFPMTVDASALNLFLRDLGPYDMPVGGTAIGRALIAAKRLLERSSRPTSPDGAEATPRADRVVLLLTDGEDHEGDPEGAADELKKAGIRVYTVGIGSRTGEPIPSYAPDGTWVGYQRDAEGEVIQTSLSAEAEATLEHIARTTGGRYLRAPEGTVGVDTLRQELQLLKQADQETRRITIHEERYLWPLLPAFLCLLLEGCLPEGRRRRARAAKAPPREGTEPRKAPRHTRVGIAAALAWLVASSLALPSQVLAWEPFRSKNADVEAGRAALAEGNHAGALAAFDRAARALPNSGGVHLGRGLALLAKGEHDKARQALLLATEPGTPTDVRARGHHNLGVSFFQRGEALAGEGKHGEAVAEFKNAVQAFKGALRTEPGRRDSGWNLELAQRRVVEQEEKAEEQKKAEEQQKKEQEEKEDGEPGEEKSPDAAKDTPPSDGAEKPEDPQGDSPKPSDDGAKEPPPEPGKGEGEREPNREPPKPGPAEEPAGEREGPEASGRPPDGKGEPNQAAGPQEPARLPPHVEQALDALRDTESSYPKERARARASRVRQRVVKDW